MSLRRDISSGEKKNWQRRKRILQTSVQVFRFCKSSSIHTSRPNSTILTYWQTSVILVISNHQLSSAFIPICPSKDHQLALNIHLILRHQESNYFSLNKVGHSVRDTKGYRQWLGIRPNDMHKKCIAANKYFFTPSFDVSTEVYSQKLQGGPQLDIEITKFLSPSKYPRTFIDMPIYFFPSFTHFQSSVILLDFYC